MKSQKLTSWTRETLEKAILSHRFEAESQQMMRESQRIALRVFKHCLPAKIRKQMAELPEGWLPTIQGFSINIGGQSHFIWLNGFQRGYSNFSPPPPKVSTVRVPWSLKNADYIAAFEATHIVADLVSDDQKKWAEFSAEYRRVKNDVRQALAAVNTTKQLIEAWPEAEPFVRKLQPSKTALPAIRVDQLNKDIGLP